MLRVFAMPLLAAMLLMAGCSSGQAPKAAGKAANPKVVRVAVIGGMTKIGLWPEIARMFEAESGCKVEVAATGPRPILAKAFKEGQADLLTMHSGDITTDLVADGFGMNMRPWTRNDLVVVGPKSDPAGIRGLTSGAEALKRIAQAQASFVDFEGIGSREVCHKLWKAAGVQREGAWVLKDESGNHTGVLDFARKHDAYVVVGLMPVLFKKLPSTGMEVLVQGDPAMRRPYVVMEANPAKLPGVNSEGAKALADFLLSEKVQTFLSEFGSETQAAGPLFYPLAEAN